MLCPVCGCASLDPFFDGGKVPVLCNRLWPTAASAIEAPKGDIRLGFCGECGFIGNVAFNAALIGYDSAYENSLHFSPTFQHYAEELSSRLVDGYGLRNRRIVEVGCGKGDFLKLLCEAGPNDGLGLDTSYEGPAEVITSAGTSVRFIREPLSEPSELNGDVVVCRHVLEHVPAPGPFIEQLRASGAGAGTLLVLEVPDAMWTLRDLGIWDLIYEHCSYFTESALVRLIERSGCQVLSVGSRYGGQFLGLEGVWSASPSPPHRVECGPEELSKLVRRFAEQHRQTCLQWNERLGDYLDRGDRVAVWGAGSKGITFVNSLTRGREITALVDINPRKHGRFVPGTGQQVHPPEALNALDVDRVVIMNGLYKNEIARTIARVQESVEVVVV